ncbi:MAG: hypothetical protein PHR27_07955 [Candidatus Cloacimonetes bacterium]|nr:hypothetical protein [Candidatus Cloacimonadota bacterium]
MRKSLLILLFIGSLLIAAEFRDGTLYLEINLSSGLNLSIEADSMDISDVSELFHHNAQGKLDIAMTTLELEKR